MEVIAPGEEEKMRPFLRRPGQVMIVTQERLRSRLPAEASDYHLALIREGYILLAKKPTF
jgi:hypothetical protein